MDIYRYMSINKSLTFIDTEVRKEDQVNSGNIDNLGK